jgi:serpin B
MSSKHALFHAANIEVTEVGTEAAAATAIIFGEDGDDGPDTTIEINRPFVFVLRDVPTGAVLFLGTFEKP